MVLKPLTKSDMKTKHLILSMITVALVVVACNKETNYGPGPASLSPLRQIFENNIAAATQSFNVNASTGGTVQGADGTTVVFVPNAFRYADGTVVTGNVQVELVEALTIADMLFLNKQAVGNDNGTLKPLTSGGQIRLTASQAGQPVKLAPGGSYVQIPSANPDPQMELFSGTVDADGTIIWDPFDGGGNLVIDSGAYAFPNDSLGWINCDYFGNWGGPLTTITVTVPQVHNDQNTIVWVVFPSINSITNIGGYDAGPSTFATGTSYAAPVGMGVTLVSLALINGDYYSSFTNSTLVVGHNETITYQPTTLAQFNTDCQAL